MHHLSPGPSGPANRINNADVATLIGRDNWCLEGANPKGCAVAGPVKSAVFRASDLDVQLQEVLLRFVQVSIPGCCACGHAHTHTHTHAYSKYMHTLSHTGEGRQEQHPALLMGPLIFEGLTPSSFFL